MDGQSNITAVLVLKEALWCWFCRHVWQLTTACGRAAPRPCGCLISTQRERAVDLLNYPEVDGCLTFMMADWSVWGREFEADDWQTSWLTGRLSNCCSLDSSVWGSELAWMRGLPDSLARQMMLGSLFDGWLDESFGWLTAWVIVT